ncbi:MAG: SH3 domain-containing protein [Chloroflexi bacterium]|nr:SH3 domain-containing protein [Chloroflexota bacterium]
METLTIAEPSPTPLPPPRLSSPVAEANPLASPSPAAIATPIPPPNLRPATPTAAPAAAPAAPAGGERLRIANTEGQGANLRAEPAASAPLVRTLRDGTELEVAGPDRDADGRHWRNVRVPSDGVSGWIVSEFVATVPGGPPAVAASPAASGASPAAAGTPAASSVTAAPAPPASPAAGTPGTAASVSGPARPAQTIGDADRAYLGELQPQVDALGKAITAANEQIERAGGRPDTLSDDDWRTATQAAAASLTQAAARIRAAKPGPATGEVGKYAVQAANYADEAATALKVALESRDPRHLNTVRTSLVRVLAEINNMNLTLLQLQ